MANTININIRNCCCTGGAVMGGGDVPPITDLPDPDGTEGPPSGYGPPSSISDRQCKVAVFLYWWLYWWLDTVLNNPIASAFVNLLGTTGAPFVAKAALFYILSPIVGAVLGSLITGGIDILDVVVGPLSAILALGLAHSLVNVFGTYNITIPVVEDIYTKLPDYKDKVICKLSQAENQSEVYGELEKVFEEIGFSDGQRALIFAVCYPSVIGLLYWSADWWSSFDDTTLASITETCCGLLEPGFPLLPGSTTRCDTANYVFDQLVTLFGNTHEAVTGYSAFPFIPLDVEEYIFDDLQGGHPETGDESVSVPPKIEETAYSMPQFYRGLARYMANQYTFLNLVDYLASDTTFSGLVEYFGENAESIVCSLYVALNASEASGALLDEIAAYLLTTDLSSEAQIYINAAMVGVLHADGDFINILFEQDSDVLGYVGEVACDGCGWVDPGDPSDTVFDFEISEQGWVIWEDMSNPDPSWLYRGPGYYPEALFHSGAVSGVGTARLAIYYPNLVSVDDITVYARGTSEILDQLSIYVSDDMVNWTAIASKTSISANYDTEAVFEDLGIVDQYVMVYCRRFWSGANCGIRLVSFHTDGA